MHRQPQAEGVGDPASLRAPQPAPEVVVGQDDLHAPAATAGGEVREADTHMLVASGSRCRPGRAAMPSMPGVGSSRYSRSRPGASATAQRVSTVQALFGSIRSGRSGNASRSASIARTPRRAEDAGLELERGEAEAVDHPARLGDQRSGSAPRPRRRARRPGGRPTCRTGRR